jgi:hypothetical protein
VHNICCIALIAVPSDIADAGSLLLTATAAAAVFGHRLCHSHHGCRRCRHSQLAEGRRRPAAPLCMPPSLPLTATTATAAAAATAATAATTTSSAHAFALLA